MKKIYLILAIVLLASCQKRYYNTDQTQASKPEYNSVQTEVVEVDGCEYIVFTRVGREPIQAIHKANCTNHVN